MEPQALLINGTVIGIFSTEKAAEDWAHNNDHWTFNISPISAWFETDMADED